jgi:hypothetical protein
VRLACIRGLIPKNRDVAREANLPDRPQLTLC